MSTSVLAFRDVGMKFGRPPAAARSSPWRRSPSRTRTYVLGQDVFKDALVRERRRSDRFGTPFAVLVVDRSHHVGDAAVWSSVIRAAGATRRAVDAMGWLEQDAVLGLLLPEISREGALKVMRHLQRQVALRLGHAGPPSMSMRLYAHGVPASGDDVELPPVDLLFDAFIPVRSRPAGDLAKRALDIIGSLVLLALFAPLMVAAVLAVKWTSPGPVLYRQVRVGRLGQPFTMLKFRSMHVNASHAIHNDYVTWFIRASGRQPRGEGAVFKLTTDPRITPVGRWLRKTSLDELPQFWNVLRGDMTVVGTHPPLPYEVDQYQSWHRRRVLEAKPGVTGAWQVKGRSRTTFDEMVRMDLEYVRTRSLWTDIRILAATPVAMMKGAC